ncbi:alpha/beta hydrolase [Streptomyces sp. O3]
MAQQATPLRDARLGRVLRLGASAVSGVVLLLPGGTEVSARRTSPLAVAQAWGVARRVVRGVAAAGRETGLVGHVVRYRYGGWDSGTGSGAGSGTSTGTDAAGPVRDAEWAVDEVVRRYGDVPVCLVGMSMGGRAAFRAGGHPAVHSVAALAPWLPLDGGSTAGEPVRQLGGRRVLIVHGTDDARTDPELSFRLAERAKKVNRDVCRFEVHTDGHRLRERRDEVAALVTDFVLGSLYGRAFSRPLTDALAAPPPLGLRMPLAAGFGKSLYD